MIITTMSSTSVNPCSRRSTPCLSAGLAGHLTADLPAGALVDHAVGVYRLLVIAFVLLTGAPAAAADLDPSALVLRQADVPSGFRLDAKESGVRTNARRIRDTPELKSLFARAGRVTGYEATFLRLDPKGVEPYLIESHVDVLRATRGAAMVLDEFDRQARAQLRKQSRLRRTLGGVGDSGWLYTGKTTVTFALAAWRHGRVFAVVLALNVSPQQTLALARRQQRRIAAEVG
jgi:hypothetical protein